MLGFGKFLSCSFCVMSCVMCSNGAAVGAGKIRAAVTAVNAAVTGRVLAGAGAAAVVLGVPGSAAAAYLGSTSVAVFFALEYSADITLENVRTVGTVAMIAVDVFKAFCVAYRAFGALFNAWGSKLDPQPDFRFSPDSLPLVGGPIASLNGTCHLDGDSILDWQATCMADRGQSSWYSLLEGLKSKGSAAATAVGGALGSVEAKAAPVCKVVKTGAILGWGVGCDFFKILGTEVKPVLNASLNLGKAIGSWFSRGGDSVANSAEAVNAPGAAEDTTKVADSNPNEEAV
jgi:hypothetical protein